MSQGFAAFDFAILYGTNQAHTNTNQCPSRYSNYTDGISELAGRNPKGIDSTSILRGWEAEAGMIDRTPVLAIDPGLMPQPAEPVLEKILSMISFFIFAFHSLIATEGCLPETCPLRVCSRRNRTG